jgi:TatD DNase family protein
VTDSHAHLSLCAEGGLDVPAFLSSWEASGGGAIIDIGIRPGDIEARASLLGAASGGVLPRFIGFSLGAWPYGDLLRDPGATVAALEADFLSCEASGIRPVAIGECGLDYHHMNAPREKQIELLGACADLAARRGLALIVHSRDAFEDTLAVVRESGRGGHTVIHCFSYGKTEALAFLDAGASLSFSGSVTFKSASGLRLAAEAVPRDRLLAETDAPYMTPGKERGKRPSTPLDVAEVIGFLAELRGEERGGLEAGLNANAARLFGNSLAG